MDKLSRRKLIIGASAGAATVGVLAAVPLIAAEHKAPVARQTTAAGPIMAYVLDPTSDQVVLLIAGQEVTLHDADLVTRLVNAAS
jgi:hypothetical protein